MPTLSPSDYAAKIQQSKSAGYTNDQIIQHLQQNDPNSADRIQQSLKAGYSSDDIVGFLSGQQPSAQPTPPVTANNGILSKISNFVTGKLGTGLSQATISRSNEVGNLQKSEAGNQTANQDILKRAAQLTAAGKKSEARGLLSQIDNSAPDTSQGVITANNGGEFVKPSEVAGGALQTAASVLGAGSLKGVSAGSGLLAKGAAEAAPIGVKGLLGAIVKRSLAQGGINATNNLGQDISSGKVTDLASGATSAAKGFGTGAVLNAGLEGAGLLKDVIGKGIAGTSGLLSGAGAKAVQEAATNPSKELIGAMRGKTTQEQILSSAKDAIQKVASNQKAEYLASMEKAGASAAPIDMGVIKNALNDTLTSRGLSIDSSGKLISSAKSNIPQSALSDVQHAVDEFNNHIKSGDTSLAAADALKQRLTDLVNYNSNQTTKTQGLIKDLANSVRDQLNKVPGYTDATKPYQKTLELMDQVNRSLGTGNSGSQETAAKKLMGALKDNASPIRQALLDNLEEKSGTNLKGKIAGSLLNPGAPSALRSFVEAIGGGGAATAAGGFANPAVLPAALAGVVAASPRLSGEAAVKYGQTNKIAGKLVPKGLRTVLRHQTLMKFGNSVNNQ